MSISDRQPAGHAPELRQAAAALVRAAGHAASATAWRYATARLTGRPQGQAADRQQAADEMMSALDHADAAAQTAELAADVEAVLTALAAGGQAVDLNTLLEQIAAGSWLLREARYVEEDALWKLEQQQEAWRGVT